MNPPAPSNSENPQAPSGDAPPASDETPAQREGILRKLGSSKIATWTGKTVAWSMPGYGSVGTGNAHDHGSDGSFSDGGDAGGFDGDGE